MWFAASGVTRSVNGMTFQVDPRARWQFSGQYDRGAAAKLVDLVKPGDEVWNVGANIGVYVLQLCRLVGPTGHVVAFEPNQEAATLLRRNVSLNGFDARVTVVTAAVGEKTGEVTFYSDGAAPMGRAGVPNPQLANAVAYQVPVTTLDSEFHSRGRAPAGLVMDIEGWEIGALLASRVLWQQTVTQWAIVELHPTAWEWSGHSRAQFEGLCAELNLEITTLSDDPDPFTANGQVLLQRRR